MSYFKNHFSFQKLESKYILIDLLCNCECGNTILSGYEQKNFYMLKYAINENCVSPCFGLGIMCQSELSYTKNIIYIENENSLIIFFDNMLIKYTLFNKVLTQDYSLQMPSYIFAIKQIDKKLIIIHEIGAVILDSKSGEVIENHDTDVITNYEFKNNFLELHDMSDVTVVINI